MQAIDALAYLPDDILAKVDKASMAVGLEVRVPLLDHRIWEWAMGIPQEMRRADGAGKAVLRAILRRHVPDALTARPKTGFAMPLAGWLRGDLRAFAEPLLSPAGLTDAGVFDTDAVRRLWSAHLAGHHDHGPLIWAILMLLSWRRTLPMSFRYA
jgi:asparagine synthase (glutamine-hydrolysing)